jgi:hypothetical protein
MKSTTAAGIKSPRSRMLLRRRKRCSDMLDTYMATELPLAQRNTVAQRLTRPTEYPGSTEPDEEMNNSAGVMKSPKNAAAQARGCAGHAGHVHGNREVPPKPACIISEIQLPRGDDGAEVASISNRSKCTVFPSALHQNTTWRTEDHVSQRDKTRCVLVQT